MALPEFYKHSGKSGAIGAPMATVAGGVTAAVLAIVYVYAINWIPFIYINLLLTLAVGYGVGFAVGYGAKVGKIRNNAIRGILGLLCGLAALYVAWAFDPLARFGDKGMVLWEPRDILAYMKYGYDNGFWTIGRGDGTVSGIFLAIVWLIEAGMIVGLAGMIALGFSADEPFCEDCNAWTREQEGVAALWPADEDEKSFPALIEGDLNALSELIRLPSGTFPRLQLDLHTCASCNESNYLTVKLCQETVDDKGEKSESEEPLLTNMRVAHGQLDAILGAGRELTPEEIAAAEPTPEEHLEALEEAEQNPEGEVS